MRDWLESDRTRFNSSGDHQVFASVAQLVEHLIEDQGVGGSRPSGGTMPVYANGKAACLRSKCLGVQVSPRVPSINKLNAGMVFNG